MDNLLTPSLIQLTLNQIILNLGAAVVLGITMALVYKRTHKGVSYSQSFVVSLVLIAMVTAAAIMVIGNSLTRAFGLIGAFSVIRFRTAIKDSRDVAFLFFSLVEGLAAGTGNYQIAIVALIIFSLVAFVLAQGKFGKYTGFDYLLSFKSRPRKKTSAPHLKIFDKFLTDHLLLSLRSTDRGQDIITSYNIRFKDNQQIKQFIAELKKAGAANVELLSSENDVDY